MKNVFSLFILVVLVTALWGSATAKMEIPGRTEFSVNDYAGIIDQGTKKRIENIIASLKQQTPEPVEVIVATFRSLDGWEFDEFSKKYGEAWRHAKKGQRDNGAIILVALKEGRAAIGAGQNLIGILTPVVTNDIMQRIITPEFSKARYAEGLEEAVEEMVKILNAADIPTGNILLYYIRMTLLAVVIIVFIVFLIQKKQKG